MLRRTLLLLLAPAVLIGSPALLAAPGAAQASPAVAGAAPALVAHRAPTPAPASSTEILGVSCPADGACVAVGDYRRTDTGATLPLLDVLGADGTWRSRPIKLPRGATTGELFAVDCPSTAECYVLGASDLAGQVNDVIRLTAGTIGDGTWSRLASTSAIDFSTLTCPSPGHCLATGPSGAHGYGYAVLNGHSTTVRTITAPGTDGRPFRPSAVACADASFCTAVGTYYNGSNTVGVEVRYDRATLSVHPVASPDADKTGSLELDQVSCPAARTCVASGVYATGDLRTDSYRYVHDPMYAVLSGGTWTSHRVTLPDDAGAQSYHRVSVQTLVSCPTFAGCVGAGNYFTRQDAQYNQAEQVFVAQGDSPFQRSATVPGAGAARIDALECPTTSRCVLATESYAPPAANGYPRTTGVLTVDSDGTVSQVPVDASAQGSVSGLGGSCPTATFCGVHWTSSTDSGKPTYTSFAMLATLTG